MVFLHLALLHDVGSQTPVGSHKQDKIGFYPYFYLKDLFAALVVLTIFFYVVFFEPNVLGHPYNYIEADPLSTPAHIVPEWYFLPFYAILRSIPSKLGGVLCMFAAIVVFFLLPFYDSNSSLNSPFFPIHRFIFWVFMYDFIVLG
jgi:ubiquinol-cytochrome c reductase cytochrome b subunit